MKGKILLIVGIVVFLIAIVLGFSLSLAKPLEIEEQKIMLFNNGGSVEYKSGTYRYQEVEDSVEVQAGDIIKTGENSSALLVFYDTQEVEIDAETELLITEGLIDANSPFLTKVRLNLESGQIWVRLQSLLHPEATFEVESEDVVATVRGTSFNVQNFDQQPAVSVFENVVEVKDKFDPTLRVRAKVNEKIEFKLEAGQKKIAKQVITAQDKAEDWVKKNLGKNETFPERLKQREEALLKKIKVTPDSGLYKLKQLGERINTAITFDKDKKELLKKKYNKQKAVEIKAMINEGKGEAAKIEFEKIKDKPEVKAQIQMLNKLEAIDIKSKLNDVILKETLSDREKQFIQDRLSGETEILELKKDVQVEDESLLADKIEPNIDPKSINDERFKAEYQRMMEELTKDADKAQWLSDLESLKKQFPDETETFDYLQEALKTNDFVNTLPEKVEEPEPRADEQQGEEYQPQNESEDESAAVVPENIKIVSPRINLAPDQQVNMQAFLLYSDGSEKELSSGVSWTLGPDDLTGEYAGVLNGNIFTSNDKGGKAYITATYADETGKVYKDNITITVLVFQM